MQKIINIRIDHIVEAVLTTENTHTCQNDLRNILETGFVATSAALKEGSYEFIYKNNQGNFNDIWEDPPFKKGTVE